MCRSVRTDFFKGVECEILPFGQAIETFQPAVLPQVHFLLTWCLTFWPRFLLQHRLRNSLMLIQWYL